MKILKIEIYSPDSKLLRCVEFNEIGLSIIYGDVEKPYKNNETTNSIGKTVLLKIVDVVLGANNSGKNTIRGLKGYKINAVVKYNEKTINVNLILGSSKDYIVNNKKMNISGYREYFNINRGAFRKQIMLEKRKGLISTNYPNATKDDYSVVLNLLYLNNIEDVFKKIKKNQDEIKIIGEYNKNFKENIVNLQKEEFNFEMKKKQIDEELIELRNKLDNLRISKNIEEIAQQRIIVDQQIKEKVEKIQINQINIDKYNEILKDSNSNDISLKEVEKIYNIAKIEIPEMIKKKLEEIEEFYRNLLEDKNEIYQTQIVVLNKKNKILKEEVNEKKKVLDDLSEIISENDSYREAIKIYDMKTKEKINIDSKIAETKGKLMQINNTQSMKSEIDILYSEIYKEFEEEKIRINRYKEFIYKMVNKIYVEETRNPYLTLDMTDSTHKYQAMPIKIDLSIDGDDGEGISAVKYLLFDLLIMNYNDEIEFLIEDSACFEGIDRRQVKNLIVEFKQISEQKNKQLIISLNKYLIEDLENFKEDVVLRLSENDTLLNIKF